jgi:hypothetical protein
MICVDFSLESLSGHTFPKAWFYTLFPAYPLRRRLEDFSVRDLGAQSVLHPLPRLSITQKTSGYKDKNSRM